MDVPSPTSNAFSTGLEAAFESLSIHPSPTSAPSSTGLEAAFESFSIREYTATMREADTKSCWPFGSLERKDDNADDPPKYKQWCIDLRATGSGTYNASDEGGEGTSGTRAHTIDATGFVGGKRQLKQLPLLTRFRLRQHQETIKKWARKRINVAELLSAKPPIVNHISVDGVGNDARACDYEHDNERQLLCRQENEEKITIECRQSRRGGEIAVVDNDHY